VGSVAGVVGSVAGVVGSVAGVVGSVAGVVGSVAGVVGADVVGADVVGAEVVGADVVGVADGVAVPEAVADALANCKGSQDSLLAVAVAAAALPVRAATAPPEAAVSRVLPAIKVTALRRPCAIRIPNQYCPILL
jgi:hypothetical protein